MGNELVMQVTGLLKDGEVFKRFPIFEEMYRSLPRDPEARIQIYHYEIAPKAWTNWHCHSGPAFFLVLQGEFEAHFVDGTVTRAKAGEVYHEPLGIFHRGYNPHASITNAGISFSVTSPDRPPVINCKEP